MGNITKITNNYDQQAYVSSTAGNRRVGSHGSQAAGPKSEIPQNDKVSLSNASKDIQAAKKAVASVPDIRSEKVDPIKQKVIEGKYEVNSEQVAEKLIGAHVDEFV